MSSIFDLSGKTPKKKPAKQQEQAKPAMPISNESVASMLQKIKDMHLDLCQKLEATEKKLGVGPDEIKQQLEELKEVSPHTIEAIKERKIELERQILGLTDKQILQRKSAAAAHKKRGKTLGARKGWIDMR